VLTFHVGGAAALAPLGGYAHAYGRMQEGKSTLAPLIGKNRFQQFVGFISRSQSIAMTYEEGMSTQRVLSWVTHYFYAQLLCKVAEHPHVMVARKEDDFYASIGHAGQLTLQSDESFGYHILVLKPEVKDIAHQKQGLAVWRYLPQPAYYLVFTCTAAGMRRGSQMKI
jgi:hypothetical protein